MASCKGKLVRFPFKKGFEPRRGKFLDGTLKTFYGPGHRPNMLYADYFGGDLSPGYKNPTDWPKAGTLLRVPQVVWLQASIHPAQTVNGHTLGEYYRTFHAFVSGSGDVIEFFDDGIGWCPDVVNPHLQEQENFARTETDRLIGAFEEAKAAIELIRPGRTWVEIIDWYDGGDVEASTHDYRYNGYTFIEVPPVDPSVTPFPFFGTNFLNIFCGHAYFENDFMSVADVASDTLVSGNSKLEVPRSILLALLPKPTPDVPRPSHAFYGYSTRLFHPNLTWAHWHGADKTLTTREKQGGSFSDPPLGNGPWFDESTTDYTALSASVFDQVADIALADEIDITHPGDTTSITARGLIEMIADHFGFDPDTGKELG